jgi:hypothetical protein
MTFTYIRGVLKVGGLLLPIRMDTLPFLVHEQCQRCFDSFQCWCLLVPVV